VPREGVAGGSELPVALGAEYGGGTRHHRRGRARTLHDIEVQVSTYTPWELWTFLKTAPRLEIVYHSIHYVDLVRSWLGNPQRVYARTVRNPRTPDLAATKSVIVMDYDDWTRVFIATNHGLDVPYPAATT